jgi:hypothetical protein
VEFAEPVPFKEDRKRSYKQFPGIQFELSVTGSGGLTRTLPEGEINEHLSRLESDRPTGRTAGEMLSFHSHDLLMSVGKTHYETADEFVAESKVHGVNKAISVTSGNEPPAIDPGRTRLFLIHPKAVEVTVTEMEEQEVEKTEEVELPTGETKRVSYTETEMVEVEETEYVPGIIGYTYLTRVVYTEDADGNVPQYIQDYEATGALDVVKVGEPVPYADQEGFDAEGNPVEDEQESLYEAYGEAEVVDDLQRLYPPTQVTVETMEKADLSLLAEEGTVEGYTPPEGHDALHDDDGDVLAVVDMDSEWYKVMPSNNVSVEDRESGLSAVTASSVVGPYRVTVSEKPGASTRSVRVEKTR